MTKKSKIYRIAMTMVMLVIVLLAGSCKSKQDEQPNPAQTDETLRFVFMADSRGETLSHPINDTVMNAIIHQVGLLSPQPAFIIFGGDMAYRGFIDSSYTFDAWKTLFAPLSGIPLYTAIGNHELYHEHSALGFWQLNQQQYQSAFSTNPGNGPAGYERLTYSFTSQGGNSFFAVLDPYYVDKDTIHRGLGGNIDTTQMLWLKSQVAQTTATHKFLIIHTPYYYISDDPDEPSAANKTLTALWSFIDANKFDMYLCGHSHLFARKTIDSTIPPNPQTIPPTPAWQNNVVQLLNGTCGAGPSTGAIDPTIKTAWNVQNDAKTYYFSVIDIVGNTVTVNSYKGYVGNYVVFDTFTITK